ncbi:MAG: ATP phosphoribosyltransferase regulatory subunit [Lachnospiraceae bacterium]|nr:ATP phosphoribosyltransferase regulatory subunit [Lachnospiraceae bacterium]
MDNKMLHTPEGVRDSFGDELEKRLQLENRLMDTFLGFGFQRIETPVFEYFDVFSKEIGTTKSSDLYKFFDKEGNTLALRPDFTPSIARSVSMYFMEEDLPMQFSYLGNTFVNHSSLQGKLRQSKDAGVEMIGGCFDDFDTVMADVQILHMAVAALKNSGLSDFQISVGNVGFLKGLCQEAGLSADVESAVRTQISDKNYFGVEELILEAGITKDKAGAFLKLTELFGDAGCLEEAEKLVKNEESRKAIEHLKKVGGMLEKMEDGDHIAYDLGLVSNYNYYTGIIFKAYTYGVGDMILKGGRYDSLLQSFGKEAPAVGFVILVDELLSALMSQKMLPKKNRSIDYLVYDAKMADEAMKVADVLRGRGNKVMCSPYRTGKSLDFYVEYGYRNRIRNLYHLTTDEKILVYDLADDSPDGLPVDNLDVREFLS